MSLFAQTKIVLERKEFEENSFTETQISQMAFFFMRLISIKR